MIQLTLGGSAGMFWAGNVFEYLRALGNSTTPSTSLNEWAKEKEKKVRFVNLTTVSLFLIRKQMSVQPEAEVI